MGLSWKDFKHRVKDQGYYAYETDAERLANRPAGVVEEQWPILVAGWGKEESKKISEQNKINRSKQNFMPRLGKKSFAEFIEERKKAGLPTDRLSNFIASRTDKEGRTQDRTTGHMIEQLNDAINELPEEDRDSEIVREKIFIENLGKDGRGRMRCMGNGPTVTSLYGRGSRNSFENFTKMREEFEKRFEDQQNAHKLEMEEYKMEMATQLEAQKEEQKKEMETQFEEQKRMMEAQMAAQMAAQMKVIEDLKKDIMSGSINFQQ